jgi:hypothetical protein
LHFGRSKKATVSEQELEATRPTAP